MPSPTNLSKENSPVTDCVVFKEDTTTMVKQETKALSAGDLQKKTKINDRLTQAVKNAPQSEKKRSSDLVPLTHRYEAMKKRLRSLITAAKNFYEATKQLDKTRMAVSSTRIGCQL